MTVADNLRKLCAAAEPYVEQLLDIAEAMSELREKATEQGIDWSQAKALLVARARDNRDGGRRVEKLISKAENAAAYVVMLDRSNVSHNRETLPQSETLNDAGAKPGSPRHVAEPAPLPRPPALPGAGSSFPELPSGSSEPTVCRVSTPLGEIEPDREAGLHVGSRPFSEPDPRDDIRNQPFYRGAT
jgi:hypothetical protein